MRIGELAHRSGVSRRLLRYYEEQGLLHPVRLPNGYREYTDGDVDAVRHIRVLLDAGLRTGVIAGILDCVAGDGTPYRLTTTGCPGVVARLSREHARITADIDRLARSRGLLAGLLDTAAPDAATPKDAVPDADVPDGSRPRAM
ncbi:MerR family transcriptional regulator [Streptomyces sp. WAC 06738]|uniref:MerR family transcriptional regulator n=1 Tax=Streptomyces sp. WAC 06738 TaxID=2203210 RepID=UPI000F6BBAE3|nr:MerR family transcriptional regulator [Streptomyces sp. WAC 06738]AZM51164.1 MerR family transcriptional regulator [Streptomyces sp. WAC 06738]